MKLLPLVLLALILAACATPQEQIASGYAKLAATEQAQVQREQAEREQSRQATESAMMTAEAAQSEIDRMNAESQATQTALENQKQAIEVAALEANRTQQAWEFGIAQSATDQAFQATSTALAIDMTYQANRAEAQEERRNIMAWLLPSLARIVFVLAIVLALVLTAWAVRVGNLDVKRRKTVQDKFEYFSRFYPARNGTYYLPPGEDTPVLVNQLDRIWMQPTAEDQPEPEYPDVPEQTAEPALDGDLPRTDNRGRAIRLLDRAIKDNGDLNYLPGFRMIEGYTSEPWQSVRDYLMQVRLIYPGTDEKNRVRYWVRDGGTLSGIREVLMATSPTPDVSRAVYG
jgi:hypothetical protein